MFGAHMVVLRAKPKKSKRNGMRCLVQPDHSTQAFVAQGESFDREDDSNVQSYLIFAGLNDKIGKDGVKCNASFKKVISTLNFSLSTTVHSFICTQSLQIQIPLFANSKVNIPKPG